MSDDTIRPPPQGVPAPDEAALDALFASLRAAPETTGPGAPGRGEMGQGAMGPGATGQGATGQDSARSPAHRPSEDFMARLVATAEAMQPPAVPMRPLPRPPAARAGAWLRLLGGWPALGGLALASAAGFWIGVAPPAGFSALMADLSGQFVTLGFLGEDDLLALMEG